MYSSLAYYRGLSVLIAVFGLSSVIKAQRVICSNDDIASPLWNAQNYQSIDGWQQWKNVYGFLFYINHVKRQMQINDPTSHFKHISDPKPLPYPISFEERYRYFKENSTINPLKENDLKDLFKFRVNRSNILTNSYNEFSKEGAVDNFKRLLNVTFDNEKDAELQFERKTLQTEWFWLLSSEISKEYFENVAVDEHTQQLQIKSTSNDLEKLKFVGRVIGAAIYHRIPINMEFVELYYKIISGEITQKQEEKRHELSFESHICAIIAGIHEFIPLVYLRIFTNDEQRKVIAGEKLINYNEWKTNPEQSIMSDKASSIVKTFWKIVEGFNETEQEQLMEFVTGSPRIPLIEGVPKLFPSFGVEVNENALDKIPSVKIGHNRIILSNYSEEKKMMKKIKKAMKNPHKYRT